MLADLLKALLGTTTAYYIKASGFHWNVEGDNFPQYHEFLGDLYAEVYGSVDRLAEVIRTLDEYAPGSMTRYIELSRIQEQTKIPRAELMFEELYQDTATMVALLNECFAAAEQENKQDIANFIAERLEAMNKHSWMLRSTLRKNRG